MDEKIIEFISQYVSLTPEEIDIIKSQNLINFYPRGTVLLSEGERAKDCYFVLQGCVRSYYLVDGEDKTTEFFTENQTINPVSYLMKEPSSYYLSCLEDCVIALGNEERNRELMNKVPKLGAMVVNLSGELLSQKQDTLDDFKKMSPEMRYLKLLDSRPDLFQRVPLYHIASYLGITPVSLSRMRKRISGGS
ncbi:Crp/Fnr family transcriptional regulator [Mangrovibacterium diazotrophicum]|uniref:CRP-like cAMP-binding protein n=1 Tax=Mangrovibacterium diazotrophicum TaxID=1261403 RepID=A0A419VV02_9BACT|nr:Crp/Fnr family transcriptional regulator [Mangrovibacterium diazotrophicum]RKD85987.1 CRP-like cAMP-binding protein [Mangrovibacterium diazotrophicum]